MKNKDKVFITVGSAAFNEAGNIKNMLRSVVAQKGRLFEVKEVLVISDGSTDKTVEEAKSMADKRIRVIDDGKRLGQAARIDQLLQMFKGDILVLVDADMTFENASTLKHLIKVFEKDIALVCGAIRPLPARTFLEVAINNYIYARELISYEFDLGKTAYVAHAFLAYSRKYGKSLTIPKNVLNPDAFSYFTCVARGLKVAYANNAVALYRSPSTIRDHLNQATRHLRGGSQLFKYFSEDLVTSRFRLPFSLNLKILMYQLLRNPFGYVWLKLLNTYCSLRARHSLKNLSVRWSTIASSKVSLKQA
ncbi:MAG: glycosyltransferase [Candidatus Chisholmbacteria bacterium]|nr:glycosyltransferase [Candidatus Chisholmbacteria bacterium]